MQIYDSDLRSVPVISQFKAIYNNRGLLYLLVVRDLTVRYKRSIIGVWWSLLNPLFTTAVMFYVFKSVLKITLPNGAPFLPYILAGVLLINFFTQGLTTGAEAIAQGSGILTKVYVRPEIFALSGSISSAINFMIGLLPLTAVLVIYHQTPNWRFPIVFVVIICMIMLTTGLSLLLSIAYIYFDDSRSLIQIFLMALQYLTPLLYPISLLSRGTRRFVELNPLTSFLQIFRTQFGHGAISTLHNWEIMIISSFFSLMLGFYVFIKQWPKVMAKL